MNFKCYKIGKRTNQGKGLQFRNHDSRKTHLKLFFTKINQLFQ